MVGKVVIHTRPGSGQTEAAEDRKPPTCRRATAGPSMPSGILVVDKPASLSSAAVVARVKRLLGAAKVGHTGTLDPFAVGVLVCCIDQATKLAQFLLHAPKTYEAVLTLGTDTDTQDATGRVVAQRGWENVTEEALKRVLPRFVGRISQHPPAFSALKHEGTPLYVLARRGAPVHKPARPVEVYHLRVLAVEFPRVRFEVRCSAGTYVRTLCADLGEALGCGGHLSELTRTECGGFRLEEALGLEALGELVRQGTARGRVIPMARALTGMPEFVAEMPLSEHIRHGRRLSRSELEGRGPTLPLDTACVVKVLDSEGELAAVARAVPGSDELQYCAVFAKPR